MQAVGIVLIVIVSLAQIGGTIVYWRLVLRRFDPQCRSWIHQRFGIAIYRNCNRWELNDLEGNASIGKHLLVMLFSFLYYTAAIVVWSMSALLAFLVVFWLADVK